MPKKKTTKEEKLEEREHKGVKYEIWDNGNELEYRVTEGLEPFKIAGANKRSLTIQIKKEIDLKLKAQESKEPETNGLSLDDMSEKELDDLFDPEAYTDKTTPKEVAKQMVEETFKEPETETEDKQNWENEEDDEVYGSMEDLKLTPEEIAAEEEVERLEEETVIGPEEREEIELSKGEQTVVEALETKKQAINPKTKLKGEIKFVVRDGKFYGQISPQTFVTIEKNSFKLIPPSTYTNMRRGRTIRVMPLDILNVSEAFDYEITFRFLVVNEMHHLAKSNDRMCLDIKNKQINVRMDEYTIFDISRFSGLTIPKESTILSYEDCIPSGPMKYPRGVYDSVSDQIMFINEEYRYHKETYGNAKQILEIVPTKTVIHPNKKLLGIVTKDETMAIAIAPMGEDDEEKEEDPVVKEVEDEIDEMFEEE